MGVILSQTMAPRVIGTGKDTNGLGQLAWAKLRGKNRTITTISSYRPCKSSTTGVQTVYENNIQGNYRFTRNLDNIRHVYRGEVEWSPKYKLTKNVKIMWDQLQNHRQGKVTLKFINLTSIRRLIRQTNMPQASGNTIKEIEVKLHWTPS